MAVVIEEKDESIQGEREWVKDSLTGTKKTFSITYLVKTDGPSENEEDVLNAIGSPPLGILMRRAYLKKKTAKEISASAGLWELECHFDSHVDPARPEVKWSWSAESIEEVITHDQITREPVVTTAGEPLIITTPIAIPILTVSRIQANFDPGTILNYLNKVNESPFWGAPVKCCLMADIKDDPEEINGITVRRVTYQIKFNLKIDADSGQQKGWVAQPLNHGTYYLENPNSGPIKIFVDKHKNPRSGNLNEDGTFRDVNLPPIFLEFNKHKMIDFNNLSLGPFS